MCLPLPLHCCPLSSGAFAYLERFVAEFDSSHSLALLPNYAFALPMARFRLEQAAAQQQQQQAATAGSGSSGGQAQPSASSGSGAVGSVSSLTLLAQALLLHPLVLGELLDKLQGQGAAREEAWQQLRKRKLFAKVRTAALQGVFCADYPTACPAKLRGSRLWCVVRLPNLPGAHSVPCCAVLCLVQASDHGSNSLGHLLSLFVERSHQLWKAADVLAWLQVAATAAADVADGKPRSNSSSSNANANSSSSSRSLGVMCTPDDVVIEGTAEDWACVARESFPAAGRNEYGHLRLADFSDAVNALPQEEMQAVMQPGAAGGPGVRVHSAGVVGGEHHACLSHNRMVPQAWGLGLVDCFITSAVGLCGTSALTHVCTAVLLPRCLHRAWTRVLL